MLTVTFDSEATASRVGERNGAELMTTTTMTLAARDCRPGSHGDLLSFVVTSLDEAHRLAAELNCGLYTVDADAYECDGINPPVLIPCCDSCGGDVDGTATTCADCLTEATPAAPDVDVDRDPDERRILNREEPAYLVRLWHEPDGTTIYGATNAGGTRIYASRAAADRAVRIHNVLGGFTEEAEL